MKILKNISLIIIGIILSLIILEIGLQTASFTLTTIKKYQNKTTKDPNIITILCLGESTTDRQWPPILQNILNEKSKNKKFNVVDKGVGATTTTIIAENLVNNLTKYSPDIVITMMGINDMGLNYKQYKIKLFSLFSLIKTHIKNLFAKNIQEEYILYIHAKIPLIIDEFPNAIAEKYLYEFNRIYKRTNSNQCNTLISSFITYAKKNDYKNKKIIDLIDYNIANKKVISMCELIHIIEYFKYYKKYNDYQIKDFIIKNKNRMLYEEMILENILMEYNLVYLLNDIKDNGLRYENKNINESRNLKKENTKKNYQYIISEIYKNNKDALVLPMQYPTLSIEKLKSDLQDSPYYDKLIFISNEENFEKALQNHKAEEIFNDMFGDSFGHCTELGNTLIAENVAETILKLYN